MFKFSSSNDLNLLFQENIQLRTLMQDYLTEIDNLRNSYSKLKSKYKGLKEENSKMGDKMKSMQEILEIYEARERAAEENREGETRQFKLKLQEDLKNLDDCLKLKESFRKGEFSCDNIIAKKCLHNRFHSFSSLMRNNGKKIQIVKLMGEMELQKI